jgi:SAM-dependent methyltransferase
MSSAEMRAHFGAVAERYDELRTPGELVTPLIERLVDVADLRGRRVLDVGCGTGRLLQQLVAHFDAKGTGVDASAEMLAVARRNVPSGVELVAGLAEELPFADSSFERAVLQLVVQHLDRPRAFAELRRVLVPGGRIAIVTTDPAAVGGFWMAGLFPSYVEIERARFPDFAALAPELEAAGFEQPRCVEHVQPRRFSRETALRKLRERAASTFVLMSDEEYHEGVARAEAVLPDPVEYTLQLLIVTAERP